MNKEKKMNKVIKDMMKDEIVRRYSIGKHLKLKTILKNRRKMNKKCVYMFSDDNIMDKLLYIGKTNRTLKERAEEHLECLNDINAFIRKKTSKILNEILKHPCEKQSQFGYSLAMYSYLKENIDNIRVTPIETKTDEETDCLEKYLIMKFSNSLYFNDMNRHFNYSFGFDRELENTFEEMKRITTVITDEELSKIADSVTKDMNDTKTVNGKNDVIMSVSSAVERKYTVIRSFRGYNRFPFYVCSNDGYLNGMCKNGIIRRGEKPTVGFFCDEKSPKKCLDSVMRFARDKHIKRPVFENKDSKDLYEKKYGKTNIGCLNIY